MALLLHACCGPCLGGSVPALQATDPDRTIVAFWENPNIHPYQEYFQRFASFRKLTAHLGLATLTGDPAYGLHRFLDTLGPITDHPARCAACFRLRLTAAAHRARQENCEAFSTTLLISPYQEHDLLVTTGHQVAAEVGVPFLDQDLRPAFKQTYEVARREELYRQKYCGCLFSEEERFRDDPRWRLTP